jgi:hypothetical protein
VDQPDGAVDAGHDAQDFGKLAAGSFLIQEGDFVLLCLGVKETVNCVVARDGGTAAESFGGWTIGSE